MAARLADRNRGAVMEYGIRYVDRAEAGVRLAERLIHTKKDDPIILALPRGGVPVAYEVALALNAPLDIIAVKKIGAPSQPELGIGAIAEGGVRVIDEYLISQFGISTEEMQILIKRETAEVERRAEAYRQNRRPLELAGRTVIIVDDGLATGITARAAIKAVRARHPDQIIFAAPVCAPSTAKNLKKELDEVVCRIAPEDFNAVGLWYENFGQVGDKEVIDLLRRAAEGFPGDETPTSVHIPVGVVVLEGELAVPANPRGIVLFAHGSGSSRHSPRNLHVAQVLREAGLSTLLFDLLTAEEEQADRLTPEHRFDIRLLADRLLAATDWARRNEVTSRLPVGYFGASTGAAAALVAASERPEAVTAVVSRGGRPDLAGDALEFVHAPTLLIVGGDDAVVIELNREALRLIGASDKRIEIVPGATHLFEEPGTLEEVARLAADWFAKHMGEPATKKEPAGAGRR